MQIVERIKNEALKQGYTLAELEQKLGFGIRSIYKWNKSAPSVEKVLAVANFLDLPLQWLVTGEQEDYDLPRNFVDKYQQLTENDKERIDSYIDVCLSRTQSARSIPTYIHENKLPILGYIAAKIPMEYAKLLKYKTNNCEVDYALIMGDDSMAPLFPKGEYLCLKQCDTLSNGDIGIFLRDQQIICRQYLKTNDEVRLHPFNPAFAEEIYKNFNQSAITLIGKVVVTPFSQK